MKPQNSKSASRGTARRLMRAIIKENPTVFALVIFFTVVSALAGAMGSSFVQRLIDDYIAPLLLQNEPVSDELLSAILIMAAIYLAGVVSTFLFHRLSVEIAQRTLKGLRDDMFKHMQSLPLEYYDTHSHGQIMSLYTNDADTLVQFISQSLPQLFSAAVTVVTVAAAMLLLNLALCAPVLVGVTVMVFVSRYLSRMASGHFKAQQRMISELNGHVEEMINGQKVIKVFCHEEAVKRDFGKKSERLRIHSSKANKYSNIIMPIIAQIGNIQYVFIAFVGGLMALNGVGGVTIGTIAAFLILSRSLSVPLGNITAQVNIVVAALAGADRIFAFLDVPCESDDGFVSLMNAEFKNGALVETGQNTGIWAWKIPQPDGVAAYTQVKGDICFNNVNFGYTPEKTVLHDMNIHARPGQKIAFVGATGAGKTTITNLINRFYDIGDGEIYYDGININDIKKDDLRRSLGIVLQDTRLFTGTIADNIRYGRKDATDKDVESAAVLANAHDFIMRLPDKYGTAISGDGSSLSGGQRQLISIARAAAANPPVMILDEATASIDTRTEALVQSGMDSLMRGRTVFVIAHRLSTVKNSDVIIVLEHGKIIEKGNHAELIAKKGKYYQLYTGGLAE